MIAMLGSHTTMVKRHQSLREAEFGFGDTRTTVLLTQLPIKGPGSGGRGELMNSNINCVASQGKPSLRVLRLVVIDWTY
jgi:hypothetical protein